MHPAALQRPPSREADVLQPIVCPFLSAHRIGTPTREGLPWHGSCLLLHPVNSSVNPDLYSSDHTCLALLLRYASRPISSPPAERLEASACDVLSRRCGGGAPVFGRWSQLPHRLTTAATLLSLSAVVGISTCIVRPLLCGDADACALPGVMVRDHRCRCQVVCPQPLGGMAHWLLPQSPTALLGSLDGRLGMHAFSLRPVWELPR